LSSRLGLFTALVVVVLVLLALGAGALWRLSPRGEGNTLQRLAKNSLFPMATSFLNKLLDMGFALYMFRVLGDEGVGKYTFAVVILGYLDILANFGLGTLLTREVAKDRRFSDRYLGNTLVSRALLWVASLAVVALILGPAASPLGITPDVSAAILLLTLGLLPSLVSGTLSALFMAYERFEHPAAVSVLTGLLKVLLGTAALATGWGFVGLAGVSVIVNLITMMMLLLLTRSVLYRPRLEFQAAFSWKMLGASYPLMLNNLLNSVFYRVDSLMLKPMAGDAALGWYGTAYKFIDGLGIISSTFTLAFFPLLSQYAHSSRGSLVRAFRLGLKLLLMVSLPISVGTTLIAPEIILLFAGPGFLPHSATALRILIWFLPFSFVNGLTQYLLIAIDQQRFITWSFLAAATFNLAANLLLIPILGYMGAAITTVMSEWILMVPFWYCVRRHLPPVPLLSMAWRPALASGAMGLEVWALRDWSILLAVALAPAVYIAGLLALRGFEKEEMGLLSRLLPARIAGWAKKLG